MGKPVLIFSRCNPATASLRLYWGFKNNRREWDAGSDFTPDSHFLPTDRPVLSPWLTSPTQSVHTAAHFITAWDHYWLKRDEDFYLFLLVLCLLLQATFPAWDGTGPLSSEWQQDHQFALYATLSLPPWACSPLSFQRHTHTDLIEGLAPKSGLLS